MSNLKKILAREFYSDISKINNLGEIPEGSEPLLINEISENLDNNILIIARDLKRYQQLKDGLEFFLNKDVLLYPQWDCVPYDRISPNKLITSKRLETLSRLSNEKNKSKIILTTIQASCQRTLSLDEVKNKFISLKPGEVIDINNLVNFFVSNGYEKTPTVREHGEFSVRGGIIDFYSPLNKPIRLDLFGNTIDSIKSFDLISQRSLELLKEIFVYPASEIILNDKTIENFRINFNKKFGSQKEKVKIYDSISEGISYPGMEHWLPFFYNKTGSIFDYIDKPIILLDHLYDSSLDDFLETVNDHFQSRKDYDDNKLSKVENKYFSIEPSNLYQNKEEYNKNLYSRNCIRISPFKKPDAINLNGKASTKYSNIKSNRNDSSSYENLKSDILDFTKKNKKIIIACSSLGSSERVAKILINNGILSNFKNLESFKNIDQKNIYLTVLNLNSGFHFDDYIFISEQDIFGEKFYRPRIIRKAENFIREISSVMPGDAVVHVDHGIGRFENLSTLEINNAKHECLLIKYANDDKLYLPVENIEVLSRYGSDISDEMLDKLGGISWTTRKENLKKKIKFLAEELISVAAKRQLSKAEMFNVPEDFYEEFCSRFSFEETNDQLNAINDVLNDLEKGLPMDRLICGDVGFGKTEIALRASFLAAMSGKQVSILAPTTLLARQHYETFKDRFKGFPINVFELSRLTPKKDSVIKSINSGSCDIVIGTHSLLGEKINFSDLGLLIIDEEQHFGVKHKEKIKKLRDNVHVLTLTATPIPRTLQLAMTGVRDLSIIASPPIDRRAIETYVFPNDPLVVKEALLRERHRGGQSFYVVPRISDIEDIEEYFKEFIPEINYITVHGQMPSKQIEDRINDFYMGSYDVLISTTIIESGLDIPNANTLIIHRSDMFGLSQLYQIRGRVGRSKVKAYAYLTYKEHKKLGKKALKRLEVLQSLDSLGAGFNLASYDLEIRGSGNLLGEEQSGQIKEVGIELYQNMLEETIDELKNTTQKNKNNQWSPKISLPLSILIPEDYISDLTIRMEIYKRLSSIILEEEIDEIAAELIDRFGSLPQEVETLIDTIGLKNLCKKTNIE
ncbi:MAG: transcription-repair coupling factor, partial [Pseudomonadota bacterium]|nr:transcription-repair coupling factor [Pseudomonadota bacterium]